MKTESLYNNISVFYPLINFFFKISHRKLVQEVNALPPGKLLEIAIGHGNYVSAYQNHIITGIDNSTKMLEVAKKNHGKNICLLLKDANELKDMNEQYDYVVMSHFISIHPQPNQLINNVYSLLKKKGKLIILNHFSPKNILGGIDYLAQPLSGIFHFKSFFRLSDLPALDHFSLIKDQKIAPLGYYRLLIYEKNE